MRSSRRRRAFTLIEAMVVVAVVGVLAVLATVAYHRWVQTAYVAEANNMVQNIRAAQESFRSENGGYLDVSVGLGPNDDYPATVPGPFKTAWGGACAVCNPGVSWSALTIQPDGPVAFGYSVVASNTTPPNIARTVNGKAIDLSAMGLPWYFIEADGDIDGNGVFTRVYGMSGTNRLFVDDEGE